MTVGHPARYPRVTPVFTEIRGPGEGIFPPDPSGIFTLITLVPVPTEIFGLCSNITVYLSPSATRSGLVYSRGLRSMPTGKDQSQGVPSYDLTFQSAQQTAQQLCRDPSLQATGVQTGSPTAWQPSRASTPQDARQLIALAAHHSGGASTPQSSKQLAQQVVPQSSGAATLQIGQQAAEQLRGVPPLHATPQSGQHSTEQVRGVPPPQDSLQSSKLFAEQSHGVPPPQASQQIGQAAQSSCSVNSAN